MMPRAHRLLAVGILFSIGLIASGCGGKAPGTYHVSGTVTFDGKPVPAGRVDFFPDFKKGNDGPQGFADIKNGKFDTRIDGQGHAGGPMVIRIKGFDGKSDDPKYPGQLIFADFEIMRDLPKETGVQDLEVPASAAQGFVPPVKSKS